jgi:zinc ribbon protein
MFCTQCGTQNLDTATSCQRCGKCFEKGQGHETGPSPSPTSASASFISAIKQRKNRGCVIAAVSAVVALIAFYTLPFMSYYSEFEPYTGTPYDLVAATAAEFDQLTQFSGLLTLITLILLALLIFRDNPFGMVKPSIVVQRRRASYAMIGMSGLSILIYVLELTGNVYRGPFDRVDVGFWLYLLGIGAVIIGSIVALGILSLSLPPQVQREGQPPPTRSPWQ